MKYENIIIEKREFALLMEIISLAPHNSDPSYKAAIGKLTDELRAAEIREHDEMPEEVVRLYSTVSIKTPYQEQQSYKLVHPNKSDISKNKLSVLAPMGLALIGYASGDEIQWQFPSGINTIQILDVKQLQSAPKIETT